MTVKQCLNRSEIEAFEKIEEISVKIYQAFCDIDDEEIKRKYNKLKSECIRMFRPKINNILLGFN